MRWEESLFVDTALPFGLRSAPKIFTAIADAVEWILKQAGVKFVIHYLDDFLLIGAPGSQECAEAHPGGSDVGSAVTASSMGRGLSGVSHPKG
jgi:hypothetical protein